ncbi:MAG: hypothetical protein KTR31_08160 [Myxococcales bacterium]|nr:hypothetical protein [Myxococcales bacterium]
MLLLLGACDADQVEPVVVAAASPLLSIDRDIDRSPWEGTVQDRLDAGAYAYWMVDEVWVVGLDKDVHVGDRVRIKPIGRATEFRSTRLDRSFARLDFGVVQPL